MRGREVKKRLIYVPPLFHDVSKSSTPPLLDSGILHYNGVIEPADNTTVNIDDDEGYDPQQKELIRVIQVEAVD